MKNAEIYRLLIEISRALEKQADIQQTTINALEALTTMLTKTVSSIDKLNAELKNDIEEAIVSQSRAADSTH